VSLSAQTTEDARCRPAKQSVSSIVIAAVQSELAEPVIPALAGAEPEVLTAASPAVVRVGIPFRPGHPGGGSVVLRGKAFDVDGHGMRDRSWGQLRRETPFTGPPYTWMTGTFPESGSAGTCQERFHSHPPR
jgi:hypothetical protein